MDNSLAINVQRFDIPQGIAMVLANTARDLGWIEKVEEKEKWIKKL